jgi:hypothetical protein
VPCRTDRDSGSILNPFQQRRSHEPDSSDPGGPRVWARGPSGWMPRMHIRRGDDRRGGEDSQYRSNDTAKLFGMARRTRWKEGAVCGKPVEAIQALALRKRENGDTARVRFRVRTREKMVSFDIQEGYRHFGLAPQMRDWFLFRCDGIFYRCIALSVGWGRSPMWFTQLMIPMVRKLRQQYRVLAYLYDFLICPVKTGKVVSMRDFRKETQVIDKLLSSLGLTRHPTKGVWVVFCRPVQCSRNTYVDDNSCLISE